MYMRKIIIMFLMLVASLTVSAQTGLKINELFEGRIIPQERMMETRVRGKSIAKYQLSYYRSLRLNVTSQEAGQVRALLGKDAEQSVDMRTSRKNPHRWDTWTCKLQMPSAAGKNRYVCYQEQFDKQHEKCELTVIYMEGSVDSLEELEQLLK